MGIDVTVASRSGRARRRGIDLHTVRRLDPPDTDKVEGIPTTTVARTLVDLAAVTERRALERALEQAYVLRLLAPGALEDALSRARGRRTAPLVELMRERRPSTLTRSRLEEAFLALCRHAQLPDPEVNAHLIGYEVDFLWRERRVVVETDGWAAHSTRRAFERDRRKDLDLMLAGFSVTRLTYDQVTLHPAETAARLDALLRRQ